MEDPLFKLPPIPERESKPPKEELIQPSIKETTVAQNALVEGVLQGVYTREDYIDGTEERVKVKDKDGKIIFDAYRDELDDMLYHWQTVRGEGDDEDEDLDDIRNEKSNS